MIELVKNNNETLSIIIRANYYKEGIEFFTPNEYSQQLAYMNRPAGYRIVPHVHNEVRRDVKNTLEVLYIKSGRVQVDFYTQEREHVKDVVLEKGDVVLLVAGGHGFTMLEPTEMIEVKQGPYAGDRDKTRFDAATGENL